MWIPWWGGGFAALAIGSCVAYHITAQCAHTNIAFGVRWEDRFQKLKVWFLEVLNIALLIQFCVIHFTKSLETGREEAMGVIHQQYLIKILSPFYYHQPHGVSQGNSVPGYKRRFLRGRGFSKCAWWSVHLTGPNQ